MENVASKLELNQKMNYYQEDRVDVLPNKKVWNSFERSAPNRFSRYQKIFWICVDWDVKTYVLNFSCFTIKFHTY